jgi:acyl carrier protein
MRVRDNLLDSEAQGSDSMPQAMMKLDEGARPTRAALLTMFRETATEVVEKDFHHVVEGSVISELAIDSLGMLEIIGSLERQLRIQIPDESLTGLQTVRDLLDVVERRMDA